MFLKSAKPRLIIQHRGYLVCNRKIGSVYDRNAVYDLYLIYFVMTHFLKIDVNVFFLTVTFTDESLV